MAGRTASVWPAQLMDGESESTARFLHGAVSRELLRRDVRLAQALVDLGAHAEADRLEADAFAYATDLLYLVCHQDTFPSSAPAGAVRFERYRVEDRLRFRRSPRHIAAAIGRPASRHCSPY